MCTALFGWCHLVNAYTVVTMVVWVAGKNCDPVNAYHSVALCDCLGCKTTLYKYLILYFLLYFRQCYL